MAEQNGLEMQTHLQMQLRTVAQRIVEAARLAAAMHQYESLRRDDEHYGQRVAVGGAGPVTPVGSEDSRLPDRPPRGEAVTDDESPAQPPPRPHPGTPGAIPATTPPTDGSLTAHRG